MVSPHELKNKAFTRVMRGYNPAEVDEHFDFLLSTYTDLYKENDELHRRIVKLEEQLEQYTKDSEAIRSALLNAQKVSAKIIDEANGKAELIVRSVKESCDAKLEEIKTDIVRECDVLNALHRMNQGYKQRIEAAMAQQKAALADLPDIEKGVASADEAVRGILNTVKAELDKTKGGQAEEPEDAAPEEASNE